MRILIFLTLTFAVIACNTKNSETPTVALSAAEQLLANSIAYHDPNGNWQKLQAEIKLLQETPDKPDRKTSIYLDNLQSLFKHISTQGDTVITRTITGDSCSFLLNGAATFSQADSAKFRLNCDMTKRYRDYHVYLYGMPMKLKDAGTILDKEVKETTFDGKPCKAIRVTYKESVGKDIWYFYFDNTTSALIGYRFYHDEAKNDGEYITFKEMATVNGVKMPKIRTWYYNSDSTLLGADIIEN
jgi:hypothetical protein